MLARPLLILFIFLTSTQALMADPGIFDYKRMPAVSKMAMSPKGDQLAFRWQDGPDDLMIVYSLKTNKATHFVDISDVNPRYIDFINDTKVIIRVAAFKNFGDKRLYEVSKIFVYDLLSRSLEQLHASGIYGVSSDGEYAYMPYYQNDRIDLHKVKLKSPNLKPRIEKGKRYTIDYFLGPDEEALVQETYGQRTREHRVFSRVEGKWKEIYSRISDKLELNIIGLTSDFQSLVYTAYPDAKSSERYYTMALRDGAISVSPYNEPSHDIDCVLTNIQRIVEGIRFSGFQPTYKIFNEKADNLMRLAVEKFPDDSVSLVTHSKDWSKLLLHVSGSTNSGAYYVLDKKKRLTFIEAQYPTIKPEHVNPISAITINARDGLKIPTLLTFPRAQAGTPKKLPAVVMPHGGPESYDRIEFDWQAQALANEGYLVIQPQFRGSSGFGRAHIEAGYGEWGGKMQDDITDALLHLIEQGTVDKNRVCIMGSSYGGYAALAGAAFTPELYRCVISINGVSDLPGFISYKGYDYGRHSSTLRYWKKAMTDDNGSDALKAVSPAYHADKVTAPVLLIHATEDSNVRIEQSAKMAKALESEGKHVRFVTIKNENHSLDSVESRSQALLEISGFINTYIGQPAN
ncbi:dipeptidyl aminopeptidase/acylaminoacyl peptidase [Alteromonadaceae bacterium 2753L.S.0a.02]|nr:dipeptidyl aminopeptidase/acylaminoacyl peptidase [Alteromonadaceae bacterium 2753L.S.0a.02]